MKSALCTGPRKLDRSEREISSWTKEGDERMKNRREHTAEFKTQVVLEMLSGEKSVAQMSREYQLKDSLLYRWKTEFLERAPQVFAPAVDKVEREQAARVAELERLVGRLTLELEVVKKASTLLKSGRSSVGR